MIDHYQQSIFDGTEQSMYNQSIELIKTFEEVALQRNPVGYVVGYSGGKDSDVLVDLFRKSGVKFMVIHKRSMPYHPQTNGLAESMNKTLYIELTKVVSSSRSNWENRLHGVLWVYRIAYKIVMGATPFELVFGLNTILPIEFLVPTLRVAKELNWTGHELSE